MKRFLLFPVLLLSLALAGCGTTSVFKGGTSITATVANPVSAVDIYRVKTVYAATLELANGYREYCWSKPYAALMTDPVARPVCRSRRQNVRDIQVADDKAFAAVGTAEMFVRNNPTISAASAIGAAWNAVTNYQTLTTRIAATR